MNSTEINTSNRSTTVNTPSSSSVVTTASRSTTITPSNRQTIINTLAVVGFIALIGASMILAVYSTRYVPTVVGRIGSAAVYLGSVFTPAPEPTLSVVLTPTASTTISFGTASSTVSTSTTTTTVVTTTPPAKPVSTTAGAQTNSTVQISGTAASAPFGLSNLAVTISAIGYLTTSSPDSFVESTTVPSGNRPAVKFTIKNIGTNWTGTWRFSASIPTQRAFVFQSDPQQSLAPNESIDYILGFDQANRGTNQTISITADSDNVVTESNENDNNITAFLNVL